MADAAELTLDTEEMNAGEEEGKDCVDVEDAEEGAAGAL